MWKNIKINIKKQAKIVKQTVGVCMINKIQMANSAQAQMRWPIYTMLLEQGVQRPSVVSSGIITKPKWNWPKMQANKEIFNQNEIQSER